MTRLAGRFVARLPVFYGDASSSERLDGLFGAPTETRPPRRCRPRLGRLRSGNGSGRVRTPCRLHDPMPGQKKRPSPTGATTFGIAKFRDAGTHPRSWVRSSQRQIDFSPRWAMCESCVVRHHVSSACTTGEDIPVRRQSGTARVSWPTPKPNDPPLDMRRNIGRTRCRPRSLIPHRIWFQVT